MIVVRPSKNPITYGYDNVHRAYDFGGLNLPDAVRAGDDGVITYRVDLYDYNWRNYGLLTTRDYGNFIIVRHVGGTYELHAHLRKGSSFYVGTQVKAGQIIARIGNTGNSTGPHLHSEYRNTANINVPVTFISEPYTTTPPPVSTIYKKKCEDLKIAVDRLNKELINDLANPSVNYETVYKSTVDKARKIADTGTL